MRFQTAPTGPGEDVELPKYFLKLHQTEPTGPGENIELPKYFLKLHQTEPTGPGTETVVISKIDTYGYTAKPNLPGLRWKFDRKMEN